ncbi:hypothetical protein WR25_25525 isoform A [Diploscapter pachys]|uniref:BACK domain-containing protein n=1 Tax=Diploscapter pachys TaxID=2018661 RepID=A0A2A2JFK7_9BILA|nr:hypothetical protein WR25_25525 isoform A [Diploscapter pachys]
MLRELLDYDRLDVRSEEDVLFLIDKWIGLCGLIGMDDSSNEYPLQKSTDPLSSLREITLSSNPRRKRRDILLAFSGWNNGPETTIEYWDESNTSWRELKPVQFPEVLQYYGVVVLEEEVYVIGGALETEIVSAAKKFGREGRWKAVCPMNEKRAYITNACVELDGFIYVCGGGDGRVATQQREASRLTSCERYNPKTNLWVNIADMRFGRSDAAAATGNGRLFVSGGFDGRDSLNSVAMYLPSANSWTEVTVLPYRVTAHAMLHNGSSLIVLGGVTGGDRTPRSVENKVLVWNQTMWRWENLPCMCYARYSLTYSANLCYLYRSTFSACFYNGEMIACGGQESSSDTIEKFDGVRWQPMGVSSTKHESAKIIVMKNWRDEAELLERELPNPALSLPVSHPEVQHFSSGIS